MFGENYLLTPDDYLRQRRRRIITLLVSGIVCVLAAFYAMTLNDNHMGVTDIINTIVRHVNNQPFETRRQELEDYFVFKFYIPRTIGCVTVGAILAVGGAVMQTIIRNPLADPYTTGISSGALLGVSICVIFGVNLGMSTSQAMMVMAFLFSMLPCLIIIFFTLFKKVTSGVIVLVGIAVSYVFSAFTTLINYTANASDYQTIYRWSLGSLSTISVDSWMYLIPSLILMIVALMYLGRLINIASVSDNTATSLGVNSAKTRILCLLLVSMFTAICVSYVGTIGFVGLIIPNIARKLVASDSRMLIPMSAIMGALFLLVSDCIARSVLLGGIPVGIVTAFIGGPMMIVILVRMKKNAWNC